MKTLSRIALGLGIALLVSAVATLIFVSATHPIAYGQAAFGLSAVIFYFVTNRDSLGRTFAGRATMFYGVSAVVGLLLLGSLVAVNYVVTKKKLSWDLTKGGIHTLAPDTAKTLETLPAEVKVTAFYGAAEPEYGVLKDLLDRYQQRGGDKLVVEWVDPMTAPERVAEKGIKQGGARVIFSRGETEARAGDLSEESLTNALVKVLRTSEKKVYFTTGHGEGDPADDKAERGYGRVAKKLADEGLASATVALAEQGTVPADASALVIAGPETRFLEPEVAAVKAYLEKGGRVLVALEPGYDDPALEELFASYGVLFEDSLVVDPLSKVMGGGAAVPVVRQYAEHDVTKDFGLQTLFPTARPLTARGDVTPRPLVLALTNPTAWGETDPTAGQVQQDEGERRGALGLAVVAQKKLDGDKEARLLAFGDADFAANQFEPQAGNADLFLNSVSWLASQEARITIRPKRREATRLLLTESDAVFLNLFSMNALPMLVLGLGLSVWLVRKAK